MILASTVSSLTREVAVGAGLIPASAAVGRSARPPSPRPGFRFLWWLVDRPNLFIKIPAARQGLPAVAACLAEGISINITLIFSLARYDDVMNAFLDGLEGADFTSLVPTQLHRFLDEPSSVAALRGLRTILLGGGPIDPTLRERAAEVGLRVVATYGSAETAGAAGGSR